MQLISFVIRIVNLIKLLFSYIVSVLLRRPVLWGYPVHASIEPTNRCNLRCPECPTGRSGLTRASGDLRMADFERFIGQLSPELFYLTLYFQGEPYVNKELFDLISHATARGIRTWTSTNGHYLNDENIRRTVASGLDKLVISLDGTDQETYGQYRIGGRYETVIEGIRRFVLIKKEMHARKPFMEIQFLVLKSNQHQVKDIRELGRALGADRTVLKSAQFYDFKDGNALMPDDGRWSRYRRTNGCRIPDPGCRIPGEKHDPAGSKFMLKNHLRNRCFRMWSGCVITWDGKVVPCCFDKDATHCLGDLNTQSFREIWKGEKYNEFRKKILENRKSLDICRNCSQRW